MIHLRTSVLTFYLLLSTFYLPVASAQVNGSVSVMADVFPDLTAGEPREPVTELRTRLFVERKQELGARWHLELSGYVDALAGDRLAGAARDAIVRPQELYLEYRGDRFELRGGSSRLVWGRLDEFQPTDVVNPIDLSRFLLEGRSEARLPVGLLRARWFLPRGSTLEGVVVPRFRASRFDQLEEPTSPFNLASTDVRIALPIERREPAASWRNVQGGARFTTTLGRVDVGATAYRGFRTFPLLSIDPPRGLLESFPRFTMVGGDFETVRGPWGIRGELAAFVDDRVQSPNGAAPIEANTVDAGIGVDRKAGSYRLAANLLYSHRLENDLSLVIAADRSFARETRTARVFAVYDPADGTTFIRGIASANVRDNVTIEGSAGLFAGSSDDMLGRLSQRDFVYARLKLFF
jgi:hypothetical protein